jgi:predicted metalloprotease with PDZ domain
MLGLSVLQAQNASYERGLMFWADIDARIRAASNGRRNLDSVVVPMMTRARNLGGAIPGAIGQEGMQPGWFTPDQLFDALAKEIGPSARALFDAVLIRGETVIPASNAFGPCFRLIKKQLPNHYIGTSPFSKMDGTGELMDVYMWERIASVPDSRCRNW